MKLTNPQFIVINLPDNIRSEIAGIQKKIRDLGLPIDLVANENLQLIIKYLKNIDETQVELVKEALRGAMGEISRFKLKITGIVVLENKEKKAQFIAVRIFLSKTLKKIYKALCERLSKTGFDITDGARFIPCIVIGDFNRDIVFDKDQVKAIITNWRNMECWVESIELTKDTKINNKVVRQQVYSVKLKPQDISRL